MKVLWLCNAVLPIIAIKENLSASVSGGWLITMSEQLVETDNIEFLICFPYKGKNIYGNIGNLRYYIFDSNINDNISYFENIIEKEKPDIVHIFGTEFKHSFDMTVACKNKKIIESTIISIQGLVSIIAQHYLTGIPTINALAFTLRDFIKRDTLFLRKKDFEKRGKYEIEAIRNAFYVIGRTDWDEACCKAINSQLKYYKCNETLRKSFYQHSWTYEECRKHSIFVSQCNHPMKGMHILLEQMPVILKKYPDAVIYTTGKSPLDLSFQEKLKQTYYNKYLGKLIRKYNLENHIVFLGSLSEEEMCSQYLKSHVMITCSTIENSPNSVGEAMIMGVPLISSDVGGVKNMVRHEVDGYIYPLDEPYMIPYYVDKVFELEEKVGTVFPKEKIHAKQTHDAEINFNTLIDIYKDIQIKSGNKIV